MANISHEVESIIERDAAIKKDLARDLINIRALARHIQRQRKLSPESLDAIASAIRRYPIRRTKDSGLEILASAKISMKNRVSDITLDNDRDVLRGTAELARLVNPAKGDIIRLVAGVESIKLIVDEKNASKVQEHIPKEKILRINRDLSEIVIALPTEAERTPGIISRMTTELDLNGINLVEIMSCAPELIIIMTEGDAVRAYSILRDFAREYKSPMTP
jgi:predicted regulator of amino acid metabolism with ACT domain